MPNGGCQAAPQGLAAAGGSGGSGGSMLEHLLALRSASAAEAARQDLLSVAAAPRQRSGGRSLPPASAGLTSWQQETVNIPRAQSLI